MARRDEYTSIHREGQILSGRVLNFVLNFWSRVSVRRKVGEENSVFSNLSRGTFLAESNQVRMEKVRKQWGRPTIKRRKEMKVFLKIFEYKETLEQEFSSLEEAQDTLNLISKNYPELRLEPYIEVEEGSVYAS
jgi:hypothetical protein